MASAVDQELSVPVEREKRGRKRKRNPENWKKKYFKKCGPRKNRPHADLSALTKCCQKNCLEKFTAAHLRKLRESFDAFTTHRDETQYLCGLIMRVQTKASSGHKRQPDTTESRRRGRPRAEDSNFSVHCYLRDEKTLNVRVCKQAFCMAHGISDKRFQNLRKKMPVGAVVPEADRRGRHGNHRRVPEAIKDQVREHIRSFPARSSHYSRNDNGNRCYLAPDLSITRMYRMFIEKNDLEYVRMEAENRTRQLNYLPPLELKKPIVSEYIYRQIFVSEFNIHFGFPRSDTCSTCDALHIEIQQCSEPDRCKELEQELAAHQELAQQGYDAIKDDIKLCEESWEKVAAE